MSYPAFIDSAIVLLNYVACAGRLIAQTGEGIHTNTKAYYFGQKREAKFFIHKTTSGFGMQKCSKHGLCAMPLWAMIEQIGGFKD
jgi:hypothetical protein